MFRQIKIISIFLLCAYLVSYGLCRWRKLLVCKETYSIDLKVGKITRKIGPGQDLRTNWIGNFKNGVAEPCYYFYYPLVLSENYLRR